MRYQVIRISFFLTLTLIGVRLFYWQVIRFDDLSSRAEEQHLATTTTDAPRGNIYFSDGSILVSNKPKFNLIAIPDQIQDKKAWSTKLSQTLTNLPDVKDKVNKDESYFLNKFLTKSQWIPIFKDLDYSAKQALENQGLSGLAFEGSLSRFYPEASMAAHILGFVGQNELGKPTGYFGLEGYYNGELKGVPGSKLEEKDAIGLPILIGKYASKQVERGSNLTLNIDRTVQYLVESKLSAGMSLYGAKSGQVIVLNPKTGAVLAMASYPNYSPGDYTETPPDYFKNPNVALSYEPGSTFKVLMMAAALNEKLIEPETKCDICSGPVQIADYVIKTWNNRYFPQNSMTGVIIHSDNTGMVFVARKLGLEKLYSYIKKFGFGEVSQIDLQDEASPSLRKVQDWREIDLATASFGQGIAVTPIQMVRAVAAIASSGKLMQPQVVKNIKTREGTIEIKPYLVGQPISKEAAGQVKEMMVEAVEQGEARFYRLKGYRVAGKTGTAQIPIKGHYDETKTVASFVGFAPADDPKFVMLVKYDEPSSSIFGAETAAPTFFAIARELLLYYNIAPTYE